MNFFRISGPLLSRFDLLFILLDKPDEEFDKMISSHIMSLHSKSTEYNYFFKLKKIKFFFIY